MGLQSALTTALTGLQAAETTIDVVGNNIANSQTVGFKESEAVFATQFLQTISIGSAPSANSGGTNPRQIGLGVKVAEITPNFTQGTISISSNPLDLAIQGDGFLIVQSGINQFYTRNGQLKLNADNEVVTTTGQRLLGYGVNDDFEIVTDNLVPLSIPLGKERVAQATRTVNLSGVLNPSVDEGATPSISESVVLGDGTVEVPTALAGQTFDINDILQVDTPLVTGISDTPTNAGSGPGAGTVNYRIAFLDANGQESTASAVYTVDNSGGAGQVDFTSIPLGSGAWTGGRRVYRTEAGGSTFYQVGDIADNVTTTFSDTVTDGALVGNPQLDTEIIDPGGYSYYVTYFDDANNIETRPTARIGTRTLTAPGGKIRLDLSDLAPPTDSNFTQIRIYRNLSSNSSEFRRIDTNMSPITVGTTSFVDNVNDATLATRVEINLDGPSAAEGNRLVDLVVRSGETYISNFFEAGTLSLKAEKGGVGLAVKTLTITGDPLVSGGPGTTVSELVDFMRDAMGIDTDSDVPATPFPTAGSVSIVNGKIVITSNLGEKNAIEVPLSAFSLQPTGATTVQTLPITFSETQAADGPGTSTEMMVFDSLGLPLKVRITTTLETKNPNSTVYRWYATSAESEPLSGVSTVVGDGLLEFDSNGDLTSATQNRISVQRNITASESPLEVVLDFSKIRSLGATDSQGNPISSLNVISQDGFSPGVLTNFNITEEGIIQGQFSNGAQRIVGQIVMARFSNNSGLQQVGDSLFDVGVNSGDPILGVPGAEGIGSLSAGAVELSNTDIGRNLIELILASTQYRGGARVITATQELLDELLALQR
jgi:flagellar hook protein FlgE